MKGNQITNLLITGGSFPDWLELMVYLGRWLADRPNKDEREKLRQAFWAAYRARLAEREREGKLTPR